MPRRSTRLPQGPPSSTTTLKRKAALSPTPTPRSSKTARTAKATPRITPLFSARGREYSDATGLTSSSSPSDSDADSDSDAVVEDVDDDDDDDEGESSEASSGSDDTARRRKAAHGNGAGGKLWREGSVTGLEPGVEVVIKRPKARAAGATPYGEETVHPNTMLFLRELKRHNERGWLKMHDPDFRASEKDFRSFVEVLTQRLIEVDESVPELPVKDIVFRIYRDVRFSKDPTPYKPYFSAAWSRTGRKGPYAAYYLQIAPGDSFIGSGSWHPEAQPLSRMRVELDRRSNRLKDVLMDERMRREFLGGAPKSVDKVVKAYISTRSNKESALKTRPQGYDKDHKDIDLLRLRNFTIGRKLKDEEIVGADFLERIVDLISVMQPYVTYLNSVLMPDEGQDDGRDDDNDDEEDGSGGNDSDGSEGNVSDGEVGPEAQVCG